MSKGKTVAQVGHLIELLSEKIMQNLYEIEGNQQFFFEYKKYTQTGRKKVVLKGTQQELETLMKENDASYYIDDGRTEVPPQ